MFQFAVWGSGRLHKRCLVHGVGLESVRVARSQSGRRAGRRGHMRDNRRVVLSELELATDHTFCVL